jgi:hypothetical protein
MMLREGLALYRRVALASVAAAAPVVFVAAPEASTRPASPRSVSKTPSTGARMILAARLQAAAAPNPACHLDNRLLRLAPHLCPPRTSPPRGTPRAASVQRPLRVPPVLLQRLALPMNTTALPCAMAATTSPRP